MRRGRLVSGITLVLLSSLLGWGAISFMLGNYVPGELDAAVYDLCKPEIVRMFRRGYRQVEQKCFT
jgi:hypothetical protein